MRGISLSRQYAWMGSITVGTLIGAILGIPLSYFAQPQFVQLFPLSHYLSSELPTNFSNAGQNPISVSGFFVQIVYLTVLLCSFSGAVIAHILHACWFPAAVEQASAAGPASNGKLSPPAQ